jgi:hypothetical protein
MLLVRRPTCSSIAVERGHISLFGVEHFQMKKRPASSKARRVLQSSDECEWIYLLTSLRLAASSSKEFAKRLSASNFRAFPGLTLRLRHQGDNETLPPLLEHSTTRNHVDYPAYLAQLAQHWPEGSSRRAHKRAHWTSLTPPRTSATRCRYAHRNHDLPAMTTLLTPDFSP